MGSPPCPPRFVCLFEGGKGKGKQEPDDAAQGAARKALEKAFGGKMGAFSKWEETQKREADFGGRGGGRGGRGWFGGRGWWEGFFDSGDDEDFWDDILQFTCALSVLCLLYGMIVAPDFTQDLTAYILNEIIFRAWVLFMRCRGYTIRIPAKLTPDVFEILELYMHPSDYYFLDVSEWDDATSEDLDED